MGEDIQFTFGTKSFEKAMQVVIGGINRLIRRAAVLGASFLSIRGAMRGIPEIGQSFSIAGDIMKRNFLEPLRQWLIPMLQSMMGWVRKNRGAFVKAGVIFMNIIKAVYTVLKQLVGMLKVMFDSFADAIFGGSKKGLGSLEKFVNMLLFKMATVFIFVGELLKPFFQLIGKGFALLTKVAFAFLKGFMKGLGPIVKAFMSIVKLVSGFIDEILRSKEVTMFFEGLGEILSTVILVALKSIRQILSVVISFVKSIAMGIWDAIGGKEGFEKIKKTLSDVFNTVGDIVKEVVKFIQPIGEFLLKLAGGMIGNALKDALAVVQDILKVVLAVMRFMNDLASGKVIEMKLGGKFDKRFIAVAKDLAKGGMTKSADILNFLKGFVAKDRQKIFDIMTKENPMIARMYKMGMMGKIEGIKARADGGPVSMNRPYMVGERGPELFVPNMSGNIVPNNEMRGGRQITVSVGDIIVQGAPTPVETAARVKEEFSRVMMNTLNGILQTQGA